MDKEEIVETNTCGYIKIDKLFINDVKELKKEYLRIKQKIKEEILEENKVAPIDED
jgi:hypothetical protein